MKIDFETVNCDLCNSSDYELFASQTDLMHKSTKKFFNVVSCKNCGLKFTNPRPTKGSISNFKELGANKTESELSIIIIFSLICPRAWLITGPGTYVSSFI